MKCVTSFSEEGYELYGKRFLETYVEHFDVPLVVYTEYTKSVVYPKNDLIDYKSLWRVSGFKKFIAMTDPIPAAHGKLWDQKRNYRFDVHKFCRKSFAQIDAAKDTQHGWLVWLDADIEWKGMPDWFKDTDPPPPPTFMYYLGRPEWHSCASFVAWFLDHPISDKFWEQYKLIYTTGSVFALPEWHDSYILDWLRKELKLPSVNLSKEALGRRAYIDKLKGPVNIFDKVFGEYGHHFKGNRKYKDSFKARHNV